MILDEANQTLNQTVRFKDKKTASGLDAVRDFKTD